MPANLTTFAGANYTVPLIPSAYEPAFCTASTSSVIFLYSHNKQFIGYINIAGGEFYNTGNWNGSWSSTPSSSSSWSLAGTAQAGPHGHHYISFAPGFDSNNRSTIYYTQSYQGNQNYYYGSLNSMCTGVWVNKTKRDNLCLQRINGFNSYNYRTQISSLGSGALMGPLTSTGDMTGGTSTGIANGYNTGQSFGLVGYNETTGWWVNGQYNGSTATLYIYKNIPAPQMSVGLGDTYWSNFNHGTKLTTTFTLPSTSNYDQYHWKIIPLDNGNIMVVTKTESSSVNLTLLTGNSGLNSTTWTASNIATSSTTTSYHQSIWQDNLPALVSYDGKYVFVFSQYYYYFSGIAGFVIRVSDGKYLNFNYGDTTYSWNPVMIGASNMIVSYGANSDGGSGQYIYEYDLKYGMEALAQGTNFYNYANGYPNIDNPSSSTCYPMIWTVPSLIPRFAKGVI